RRAGTRCRAPAESRDGTAPGGPRRPPARAAAPSRPPRPRLRCGPRRRRRSRLRPAGARGRSCPAPRCDYLAVTEFSLLGPLQAAEDGRPLQLPPGKPSALLARLLLDANRVVSAETLVEGLWGESPPPSAGKVLQAHVSHLRKLLGRERIETRPPGYALRAEPEEIDLRRFERLVESAGGTGSPERRAELLRDALALWRGPALAEFRQEPFAAAAARRLAELRLSALERRFEAELELGGHARLVAELEDAVSQEPLREPLRAALMLALYRSGRQAEALARYRDGRRLLVEQLGIEPGPALQDLERAILRQDSSLLQAPAAQPARGPVIGSGARLAGLLAPLCAGGRELLLV